MFVFAALVIAAIKQRVAFRNMALLALASVAVALAQMGTVVALFLVLLAGSFVVFSFLLEGWSRGQEGRTRLHDTAILFALLAGVALASGGILARPKQ